MSETTAGPLLEIFHDIGTERIRQEQLRLEGKFPATCATVGGPELSDDRCLRICVEEIGEIADALNERENTLHRGEPLPNPAHLRDEIIQLAACCIAWVQRIDYYVDPHQYD